MKITSIILTTLFFPLAFASGELINVPTDYPTIQAAIDSAQDYDTVVIAPGTYTGSGNCNLSFRGKSITVRSSNPEDYSVVANTIIDCQGRTRGFQFFINENKNSKLSGITITNGYGTFGGAIYCYNGGSPSIKNCILKGNRAPFGGAIACGNSLTQPTISNCIIKENTAMVGGGGIYVNAAAPVVKNCIVVHNDSPNGGGLYCHNPCQIKISNCTIADNHASSSAGGTCSHNGCDLIISNSIIWGNEAPYATQIRAGSSGDNANVYLNYCDIQNNNNDVVAISPAAILCNEDSIYSQPGFSTNNSAEYHLAEGSVCINAGDPDYKPEVNETDIDGEPRLLGLKVDIGADEYLLAVTASVKVNPPKINLKAGTKWLTVFINLPEGLSADNIETASLLLNERVRPSMTNLDTDSNRLLAKFYLDNVLATIDTEAEQAIICIEGNLIDGQTFNGSDTIELMQDKSKKSKSK
jgi:hypothetical protein